MGGLACIVLATVTVRAARIACSHNGSVLWSPPPNFRERCNVTLTGQPHSIHTSNAMRLCAGFSGCTLLYYNGHERRLELAKWQEYKTIHAISRISHPVMAADMFRLAALYNTGGYYMDLKSGFQPHADWRCLAQFAPKIWVTQAAGSTKPLNWLMYSTANHSDMRRILDNIVSDVLAGRESTDTRFETRVWELTGPAALRRYLGNVSTVPAEEKCCVYDYRGSGTSWSDKASYHSLPDKMSVYKHKG